MPMLYNSKASGRLESYTHFLNVFHHGSSFSLDNLKDFCETLWVMLF